MLGVWAHRQALAARDAGAEVRVVVLHRLVPPRASFSRSPTHPGGAARALRSARQRAQASGARRAGRDLCALRVSSAFQLLSIVGSLGGAGARPRTAPSAPLVCFRSDPRPQRGAGGRRGAARAPARCHWSCRSTAATCSTQRRAATPAARPCGAPSRRPRRCLANSRGIAELSRSYGAEDVRVVHLGADSGARPGQSDADRPSRPRARRWSRSATSSHASATLT